jgi:hypothetical protein
MYAVECALVVRYTQERGVYATHVNWRLTTLLLITLKSSYRIMALTASLQYGATHHCFVLVYTHCIIYGMYLLDVSALIV